MNKRWIGIGAVVVLLALPFVLGGGSNSDKTVQTEVVSPRQVRASILASGNLVFREQAQLSPEVIGKVSEVLVEDGDKVEKGQVVLRLDDQVYRAEVEQQEAGLRQQRINIDRRQLSLADADREWKRAKELHARGLLDDKSYDQARYNHDVAEVDLRASREDLKRAEAMLAQSRERLAKTEIRAPISGTVVALAIKVGETAVSSATGIAGSSLMTIADTNTLMTEIYVDEADIANIHVDQAVAVYSAAFPDAAIDGTVESIPLSPRSAVGAASALARDYAVKVRLTNTHDLALRPGMTCRAEIFTATADQTLAVPVAAVFSNNSADADVDPKAKNVGVEHYLFVEKDGKAVRRVVEVGLADDSYQQITQGISQGEHVIVGPYKILRHLKDGESVTVDNEKHDDKAKRKSDSDDKDKS